MEILHERSGMLNHKKGYCSLLSTMRSREISSIIIIQNFAQLRALFEDAWETIPGNCDTFIYLGGNEQSPHRYVSELLGKGTIDKKSSINDSATSVKRSFFSRPIRSSRR